MLFIVKGRVSSVASIWQANVLHSEVESQLAVQCACTCHSRCVQRCPGRRVVLQGWTFAGLHGAQCPCHSPPHAVQGQGYQKGGGHAGQLPKVDASLQGRSRLMLSLVSRTRQSNTSCRQARSTNSFLQARRGLRQRRGEICLICFQTSPADATRPATGTLHHAGHTTPLPRSWASA